MSRETAVWLCWIVSHEQSLPRKIQKSSGVICPRSLSKSLRAALLTNRIFSLVIQQDQTFLNGFKYLLEKTLLFRQLDKKALEILLLDVVNAADQLVNGVFFMAAGPLPCGLLLYIKRGMSQIKLM